MAHSEPHGSCAITQERKYLLPAGTAHVVQAHRQTRIYVVAPDFRITGVPLAWAFHGTWGVPGALAMVTPEAFQHQLDHHALPMQRRWRMGKDNKSGPWRR
jgi:hypothetical protein